VCKYWNRVLEIESRIEPQLKNPNWPSPIFALRAVLFCMMPACAAMQCLSVKCRLKVVTDEVWMYRSFNIVLRPDDMTFVRHPEEVLPDRSVRPLDTSHIYQGFIEGTCTGSVTRLFWEFRYLSCDDCLEDDREDYQNCSVLCCVWQLCTVIHTHVNSY